MRAHICIGFVAVVGLAGCHARFAGPPSARTAELRTHSAAVPLPAHTPFDGDDEARSAFLESFAQGFRLGIQGYRGSFHMTYTKHLKAHSEGYFAGQDAGLAAYDKQNSFRSEVQRSGRGDGGR
jgi:hypothetical protein